MNSLGLPKMFDSPKKEAASSSCQALVKAEPESSRAARGSRLGKAICFCGQSKKARQQGASERGAFDGDDGA